MKIKEILIKESAGPIITQAPTARDNADGSMTVFWQTNIPSTGSVQVGNQTATATTLSKVHSVTVAGVDRSKPASVSVSASGANGGTPTTITAKPVPAKTDKPAPAGDKTAPAAAQPTAPKIMAPLTPAGDHTYNQVVGGKDASIGLATSQNQQNIASPELGAKMNIAPGVDGTSYWNPATGRVETGLSFGDGPLKAGLVNIRDPNQPNTNQAHISYTSDGSGVLPKGAQTRVYAGKTTDGTRNHNYGIQVGVPFGLREDIDTLKRNAGLKK